MSWEEYGMRMMALSQRYEDDEFKMYFNAWLHQREVGASRKDKYVYRNFNDFYRKDNSESKENVFKELKARTRRIQQLQKGGT